MKYFITLVCILVMSAFAGIAGESNLAAANSTSIESYSMGIEGFYKNGSDWIRVNETWAAITINGKRVDSDFTKEMDPQGNTVLKLEIGGCITVYSGGRSLYYNGTTYYKN